MIRGALKPAAASRPHPARAPAPGDVHDGKPSHRPTIHQAGGLCQHSNCYMRFMLPCQGTPSGGRVPIQLAHPAQQLLVHCLWVVVVGAVAAAQVQRTGCDCLSSGLLAVRWAQETVAGKATRRRMRLTKTSPCAQQRGSTVGSSWRGRARTKGPAAVAAERWSARLGCSVHWVPRPAS